MSEFIYNILVWVNSLFGVEDGIAWAVVLLLGIFFALGLRHGRLRQIAPGLMVSVGILGTFCGIFIALHPLDFSPGKINDSIETLLNGMATAFITSLLGIAAAIVFRFRRAIIPALKEPVSPEQAQILERLDAIKQAIAGEGDSSLVTQIQKMRDENRDGFNKLDGLSEAIRGALVENLEALTNDIREIIGKQLGESLQTLIKDIEKALIEQFGKTFIEFNEATQAIKKWQEDHRGQVEQLTAAFDLAATRIEQIATDCATIPSTMQQLREMIEVLYQNVEVLNNRIEAFAGMRQQAEEAFPVIKEHLDRIGEDLKNSAAGFTGLEETIRTTFENAERETRDIAQQHSHNIQEMAANMRETMEKAQRAADQKVAGIVEGGIQKFTKQINEEIDRLTREWGDNMVSIAEQCKETIDKVNRQGQ